MMNSEDGQSGAVITLICAIILVVAVVFLFR